MSGISLNIKERIGRQMYVYLLILVCSVFLGTEIFAIQTPVAQVTIYRIFALCTIPLLIYQVTRPKQQLKVLANSTATNVLVCFITWWILASSSILWAVSLKGWFQHLFLMSIGMSGIIALYFWVNDLYTWKRLLSAAWVSSTGLVVWGFFEILTNVYVFADLNKLDKYHTFTSQPGTRIPITHFENQNDFATMLLAYIAMCLIMYYYSRSNVRRIIYALSFMAASYLIYRSGSRLSLICLFIFIIIHAFSYIRLDFKVKHYLMLGLTAVVGVSSILWLKPSLITKVTDLFYFGHQYQQLSGDTVRMNLWRNGLLFLGETFGLGVGLGNVETWMLENAFWTTDGQQLIVNMHNWWLEILVGHGLIAFLVYVLAYGLLLIRLYQFALRSSKASARSAHVLFSFMIIFIFASITSANNMLIEWHWLFFGLIISFVKCCELKRNVSDKKVVGKLSGYYVNKWKEKVYQ
ncbi:O-antigen ligase domain-containing protein [Aerococcaceae bacterium WS4759]|uniref:O-antigen ligase domain-containing protein n=2 Tax=Fundicoccus ignavus TaxID=2664442 RepID=A0A6I2GD79_9LACT|nr:O-antigen ligase domain-containing protein [Fundicoccus ignavus]